MPTVIADTSTPAAVRRSRTCKHARGSDDRFRSSTSYTPGQCLYVLTVWSAFFCKYTHPHLRGCACMQRTSHAHASCSVPALGTHKTWYTSIENTLNMVHQKFIACNKLLHTRQLWRVPPNSANGNIPQLLLHW